MDCDGMDCDGCAVCDTLDMSSDEPWEPTWVTDGRTDRCVFCKTVGPLAYYTRLGHSVGVCCGSRI